MGKILEGLGQLIVGINYLLTCFLVLGNFGLGWGFVAFFIPPIGAIGAPFLVGTWPIFLIGSILFIVGTALNRSQERKYAESWRNDFRSEQNRLAQLTQNAEVIGHAEALRFLESDPQKFE